MRNDNTRFKRQHEIKRILERFLQFLMLSKLAMKNISQACLLLYLSLVNLVFTFLIFIQFLKTF